MSESIQSAQNNQYLDELVNFINNQELEEIGFDSNITETYAIQDMTGANTIVRNLLAIREEIAKIDAAADTQKSSYIKKVDYWHESSVKSFKNTEVFLLRLLQDFAKRQLENSKKKSVKLIDGILQFRKSPDSFEYDEKQLLPYLQKHYPVYVRETPEIKKTELKKAGKIIDLNFVINNEVVPGIVITPREESFDVKAIGDIS